MTSWKEYRPEQDTDEKESVVSSRDAPPPNGGSKGAMTTCPWMIHPQVDESSTDNIDPQGICNVPKEDKDGSECDDIGDNMSLKNFYKSSPLRQCRYGLFRNWQFWA